MASPRLVKVVVSSGTGSAMKKDKDKNDFVIDRLAKLLDKTISKKRKEIYCKLQDSPR